MVGGTELTFSATARSGVKVKASERGQLVTSPVEKVYDSSDTAVCRWTASNNAKALSYQELLRDF